jgi:hypothetical protein
MISNINVVYNPHFPDDNGDDDDDNDNNNNNNNNNNVTESVQKVVCTWEKIEKITVTITPLNMAALLPEYVA